MEKLKRQFLKLLRENPELERQAMEDLLDDSVSPEDFDLDMNDVGEVDPVGAAINLKNQQEVQTLDGWINQIDGFLKTLNSDDPSSIQSQLAMATRDTILDRVKKGEQTKIARIASDLASLHQSLLGFKAMSGNAQLKNV